MVIDVDNGTVKLLKNLFSYRVEFGHDVPSVIDAEDLDAGAGLPALALAPEILPEPIAGTPLGRFAHLGIPNTGSRSTGCHNVAPFSLRRLGTANRSSRPRTRE